MFFILIEKSVVVVERWDGAPVQCLNKGCFETGMMPAALSRTVHRKYCVVDTAYEHLNLDWLKV